jgi:hypothetical protein
MAPGYVYACALPDALMGGWNLYKVGHTTQNCIMKRMSQYPKGTRMLWSTFVRDSQATEGACLELLNDHPRIRQDGRFGREYFSCDLGVLMDTLALACKGKHHQDTPEAHMERWGPLPDLYDSDTTKVKSTGDDEDEPCDGGDVDDVEDDPVEVMLEMCCSQDRTASRTYQETGT